MAQQMGLVPNLTTAAQFPATVILSLEGGLRRQLAENGARNPAEASVPFLLESLRKAMADPLLSDIDFAARPLAELVNAIIREGSTRQRAAFARYLTSHGALCFPGLWAVSQANHGAMGENLDFLADYIHGLAAHYGKEFVGDIDSVIVTILHDYGSLSIVDFLLFFEKAKSGIYRQNFQHIASRGINYDFLKTWLDAYADERELALSETYDKYKIKKLSGGTDADDADVVATATLAAELNDGMERGKARDILAQSSHADLEGQADVIRNEWRRQIFETFIFRQWHKTVEVEVQEAGKKGGELVAVKRRQEVICDEGDAGRERSEEWPVERIKPGGEARLLKRAIFEYHAFGDAAAALATFDSLRRDIREMLGVAGTPRQEATQMKTIVNQVAMLQRELPADRLLRTHILTCFDGPSEPVIQSTIKDVMAGHAHNYHTLYLPACIRDQYPALAKGEFIWRSVLALYVRDGHINPVQEILFGR